MASTEYTSADEGAARVNVALQLADEIEVIERGDPAAALAYAERITPHGWAVVARRTGADEGYTPSPATRAAAITVLRERANVPDPFAAFPS